MGIRILCQETHYENPSCKCDHAPLFPELGNEAAPEPLRPFLKAGIGERDSFECADWFRMVAKRARDATYKMNVRFRAPIRNAEGRLFVIVTWSCNEQGYGGHTNAVTYDLVHALVELPENIFAAMVTTAREHVVRATVAIELKAALEEADLSDAAVERRRRQLYEENDLVNDRVWHGSVSRNVLLRDHGLTDHMVGAKREEITSRITAEVRKRLEA